MTVRLAQLKAGDPNAAGPIWEMYFARLVGLARLRLQNSPRVASDEEDVALSAFNSFWEGVAKGRFPNLNDRHDLWHLLFVITDRKARRYARSAVCEKRYRHSSASDPPPDEMASPGPTSDEVALVSEECGRLLAKLGDKSQLREVAVWKMEGYTNAEIAVKIDRTIPTVERKLKHIRELWQDEVSG